MNSAAQMEPTIQIASFPQQQLDAQQRTLQHTCPLRSLKDITTPDLPFHSFIKSTIDYKSHLISATIFISHRREAWASYEKNKWDLVFLTQKQSFFFFWESLLVFLKRIFQDARSINLHMFGLAQNAKCGVECRFRMMSGRQLLLEM